MKTPVKLIRVVKNWNSPLLARQSPGNDGVWGEWCFTEQPVPECDGLLVLNHPVEAVEVLCPAGNVWALMQEPDAPGVHDWMREGHAAYHRVFTHAPAVEHPRYIRSHPAVPWHVGQSYGQLQHMPVEAKSAHTVWVTSDLRLLPGHRRRMALLDHLRNIDPAQELVHLYGRGIDPIADKWTVLAPAMYALALENAAQPDYWTEKLADCFLAGVLPLYYGCPNIADYFPEDALIRIEPHQLDVLTTLLAELPGSGEWERRYNAIAEARRLVLEKYQFYPWMVGLLEQYAVDAPPVEVRLDPWRPSWPTRWRNLRRRWGRRLIAAGHER